MVEKSRRDRVGLGLIGLGPYWEKLYREPILRMQHRLTVKLVYDPVGARAKSVASEFDSGIAGSVRQLLSRPSLQGLLVLDPGWCGAGILNLIAQSGKPAFVARQVLSQASSLAAGLSNSQEPSASSVDLVKLDQVLMPELNLRFTPTSCRLRELIATKLGPARKIEYLIDPNDKTANLAAIIDWCSHIMQHSPTRVHQIADANTGQNGVVLEFSAHQKNGSAHAAPHRLAILKPSSANRSPHIQVECENGEATLHDRTHIAWQTAGLATEETLTDERTEIEILIDQFCRRALGGLNPVGRLSDYTRAVSLANSIDFNAD